MPTTASGGNYPVYPTFTSQNHHICWQQICRLWCTFKPSVKEAL